jgi:hypothetical protein
MRSLVEELPSIDIKDMASILEGNQEAYRVEFLISNKYTQSIDITTTRGSFGGLVYWFICPGCKERVKKLCLYQSKIFLCRNCQDLTYKTQAIREYRKDKYVKKKKPRTIKDSMANRERLFEELKKYLPSSS